MQRSEFALNHLLHWLCLCSCALNDWRICKTSFWYFFFPASCTITNIIIDTNTHFNWNDKRLIPNDMIYDWNQWILCNRRFFFPPILPFNLLFCTSSIAIWMLHQGNQGDYRTIFIWLISCGMKRNQSDENPLSSSIHPEAIKDKFHQSFFLALTFDE